MLGATKTSGKKSILANSSTELEVLIDREHVGVRGTVEELLLQLMHSTDIIVPQTWPAAKLTLMS